MTPVTEGPNGRPVLRLDRNEGPQPPRALLEGLLAMGPDLLRRYPDPRELEQAIAAYHDVDPDRVLVGTGEDDVIDRLCRRWLAPGAELVVPYPTFAMIPAFAEMAGGTVVPVPGMWNDCPVQDILDAVTSRTRLVVVVSPNNPSGAAASPEELVALASALPEEVILFVDGAYVEFADTDPTPLLLRHPNVLMGRTFSKAFGLAGLRVGYLLGSPEHIAALREVSAPYPVSGPALEVVRARLREDGTEVARFVGAVKEERTRLVEVLRTLGAEPIPSQANFVFSRFRDADWVRQGLAALGIRVRAFGHLPDGLRITCPGQAEEYVRLEAGLRTVLDPEAFLFDMDGVLADVSRSYRRAIRETCDAFGVEVTDQDVARVKAAGNANDDWDVTRRLLLAGGVDRTQEEVKERFETLYQGSAASPGLWREETLIPSPDWLRSLAERVRLAVVTGRPRADAQRFLEQFGLSSLFDVVVTRDDVARLKPDPESVALALSRLGVRRAWMVGDTPDDVAAALRGSVVPVGIAPPGEEAAAAEALGTAGAARVLTRLEELTDLLPGGGPGGKGH